MQKKVIIIGASGHGKVISDIVLKSNDILVGFLDDGKEIGTQVMGYTVLGKTEDALKYKDCSFVIGIGSNAVRKRIDETYQLNWYTAIHPSASIASHVNIQEGTVIMAHATVNSDSVIGRHCIINTGSIVEHDNTIGDYVHLSPHVTLCGTVSVGTLTHVGAGATVINNTTIADCCIVGAGSTVIKNIEDSGTYVGVPVRKIK